MRKKLGVLLINQNNKRWVSRLLANLSRRDCDNIELFILDNNCSPSERTKRLIEKSGLTIFWDTSGETLSLSAGYNGLFARAKMSGCDYVWIIGEGGMINNRAVETLQDKIQSLKRGFLGSVIENETGDMRVGGGRIWNAGFELWPRESGRRGGNSKLWQSCDWISLDNLVVSAKEFEQVGGLDTRLFFGFEGVDLCLRLKKAGIEGEYGGEPLMMRKERLWSDLQVYFLGRNPALVLKKNMQGWTRNLRLWKFWLWECPVNMVYLTGSRRGLRQVRWYVAGVRDGFRTARI